MCIKRITTFRTPYIPRLSSTLTFKVDITNALGGLQAVSSLSKNVFYDLINTTVFTVSWHLTEITNQYCTTTWRQVFTKGQNHHQCWSAFFNFVSWKVIMLDHLALNIPPKDPQNISFSETENIFPCGLEKVFIPFSTVYMESKIRQTTLLWWYMCSC